MILFCIALLISHVVYTVDVHDLVRSVAEHDKRERENALQAPIQHAGMSRTDLHKTDRAKLSRDQLIQHKATIAVAKNNEYQRWHKEDERVEIPIQALLCGMASPVLLGSVAAALSQMNRVLVRSVASV